MAVVCMQSLCDYAASNRNTRKMSYVKSVGSWGWDFVYKFLFTFSAKNFYKQTEKDLFGNGV